MGLSLQIGHPSSVLIDDAAPHYERALIERFGADLPLGADGVEAECTSDMGWSWWSAMQASANEQLGEGAAKHILAVDAWHGVYVDAPVERALLWPDGMPDGESDVPEPKRPGFFRAMLLHFGLVEPNDDDIRVLTAAMVKELGARRGEFDALQVSSLGGLIAECEALAEKSGIDHRDESLMALVREYEKEENGRDVDDDPHVQCLCYTTLIAREGLLKGRPLWVLK